jgi:hypothetical protein
LITDPASKIAVRIAKFNIDCIMQGTVRNSAEIHLVSKKYKIKTGDVVYAQKEPGTSFMPRKSPDSSVLPSLWER